MKIRKGLALGLAILGAFGAAATPTIEITSAQQRYPWTNQVDVLTSIGALEQDHAYELKFRVNNGNETNTIDPHRVITAASDGFAQVLTNVFDLTGLNGFNEVVAPTGPQIVAQLYDLGVMPASDNSSDGTTYVPGDYLIVDLANTTITAAQDKSTATALGYNSNTYKQSKMVFRKIPKGRFNMQAGSTNNLNGTEVTLGHDYYIAIFDCTESQYNRVMDAVSSSIMKPMRSISWETWTTDFIPAFNQKFGNVSVNGTNYVASLPTEAQWERAARAGTRTEWFFGSTSSSLGTYAVYGQSGGDSNIKNVGTKTANAWGLYDVYGNVFEWCLDTWNAELNYLEQPGGPTVANGSRVQRGGTFCDGAEYCSSVYRKDCEQTNSSFYRGVRLVLNPVENVTPTETEGFGFAADTRSGPRTVTSLADLLPITYSGWNWGDTAGSATVTFTQDEGVSQTFVSEASETGAQTWLPTTPGTYTFTHTNSVTGGAAYTATFIVPGNLFLYVNLGNACSETNVPVAKAWYEQYVGTPASTGTELERETANSNAMKQNASNGIPFWVNYVMGWDPTATTNSLGASTSAFDADKNTATVAAVGRLASCAVYNDVQMKYRLIASRDPRLDATYTPVPGVPTQLSPVFTNVPFANVEQRYYRVEPVLEKKIDGNNGTNFVMGSYVILDLSADPITVTERLHVTDASDFTNDIYKTTKMVFRKIPAGSFWMQGMDMENLSYGKGAVINPHNGGWTGSGGAQAYYKPGVAREIAFSNDYYIAIFECTVAQWETVTGISWTGGQTSTMGADNKCPIEHIPFVNVKGGSTSFVPVFNAKMGANAVYLVDLPNGAQWERAARAGTTMPNFFGPWYEDNSYDNDTTNDTDNPYTWKVSAKNAGACSDDHVKIVGTKAANAWGLYDVYGNAMEWCDEWCTTNIVSYVENGETLSKTGYYVDTALQPGGPSQADGNGNRVRRGGSAETEPWRCSSWFQSGSEPSAQVGRLGFRLILTHKPAAAQ